MKKHITLALSLLIAGACFAQGKPVTKKAAPVNKEQSATVVPALKGPVGLGALKIGMTKEAVEALRAADGIYLTAPMTPFESASYIPTEGIDLFDAELITPLSTTPMKATLRFSSGVLDTMSFYFTDSPTLFDDIMKQISEKYAPGKVEDGRKEEQCIFKNGSNYKISRGELKIKWSAAVSSTERIETKLEDWVHDICPNNVLTAGMSGLKMKSLIITKIDLKTETKPANPF